jgi:hypothetical protein
VSTGLSSQPLSAARSRRYRIPVIVVTLASRLTVQWLRVRLRMRTAGVILVAVAATISSLAGCAGPTANSPVRSPVSAPVRTWLALISSQAHIKQQDR